MRQKGLMPLTMILMAINILIFILETIAGGSENATVAVRFGAQVTALVLAGQWWRLFASMFVHFGLNHLVSNMVTLFLFGNAAERLLGWKKMLILYLLSGLCGNLFTLAEELMTGEYAVSAGASGAIFGLVGIYIAMALIPELRRFVSVRNVIIMLIVNLAYGLDDQSINLTAHIGGLLAGTVISYIMFIRMKKKSKQITK